MKIEMKMKKKHRKKKKKNKKLPKGKTLENLHIFANFKAKISLF